MWDLQLDSPHTFLCGDGSCLKTCTVKPYSDGDPGIGWDFSQNSPGWVVLRVTMGPDCLCDGQCVCDVVFTVRVRLLTAMAMMAKVVVMVITAVVIIMVLGMVMSWWRQWWWYDDGGGDDQVMNKMVVMLAVASWLWSMD